MSSGHLIGAATWPTATGHVDTADAVFGWPGRWPA